MLQENKDLMDYQQVLESSRDEYKRMAEESEVKYLNAIDEIQQINHDLHDEKDKVEKLERHADYLKGRLNRLSGVDSEKEQRLQDFKKETHELKRQNEELRRKLFPGKVFASTATNPRTPEIEEHDYRVDEIMRLHAELKLAEDRAEAAETELENNKRIKREQAASSSDYVVELEDLKNQLYKEQRRRQGAEATMRSDREQMEKLISERNHMRSEMLHHQNPEKILVTPAGGKYHKPGCRHAAHGKEYQKCHSCCS